MSFSRSSLYAICVATLALGGTVALARAAEQQPAILTMMPGSWSCTFHGPKGTQASTLTVTSQNANWVLIASKDGAYGTTPAHESVTLVGYDSKKGQYVGFGGNTLPGGGWGLGIAKASPTATSFTVLSAYPPDPTHDKTSYTFTSTSWNWTDNWTEKGKPMTGKGTCTKQ
ncbi:MAG TPA: hypothetical protein VIW73_12305 [Candidatus Cybelea sp.]